MTRTTKTVFTLKPLALALLTLAASAPAFAETELEALRREVAEQKILIQQIMAAQKNAGRANRARASTGACCPESTRCADWWPEPRHRTAGWRADRASAGADHLRCSRRQRIARR